MAVSQAYIRSLLSDIIKDNQGVMEKFGDHYAQQLIADVTAKIREYIRSFSGGITYQVGTSPDGQVEVRLAFDERTLWRPSLYQGGTDNIVLQFEKGWHAKGRVRGKWHGQTVWSRQEYEGAEMLSAAVEAFNATAPRGVKATLLSPYN